MRSTNLSAVKAARRAIELVLSQGQLDKNPVPYFEPTNIGSLPHIVHAKEDNSRVENDQGNRIRAASHLALQSASEALAAVLAIGELPVDIETTQRAGRLAAAAEQMQFAAALADEAEAVFAGTADPQSDGSITVSKS